MRDQDRADRLDGSSSSFSRYPSRAFNVACWALKRLFAASAIRSLSGLKLCSGNIAQEVSHLQEFLTCLLPRERPGKRPGSRRSVSMPQSTAPSPMS